MKRLVKKHPPLLSPLDAYLESASTVLRDQLKEVCGDVPPFCLVVADEATQSTRLATNLCPAELEALFGRSLLSGGHLAHFGTFDEEENTKH